MSIKVMTHVWDHSKQRGSALLMMLALADFCDDEGVCYPGVTRLAQKTRLGHRQAQKLLTQLEDDKEIRRELQTGIDTSHGKTNRYYMLEYRKSAGLEARGEPQYTPGVNGSASLGVNHSTPKPSVEPSEEPIRESVFDLWERQSKKPLNNTIAEDIADLVKEHGEDAVRAAMATFAPGMLTQRKLDAMFNGMNIPDTFRAAAQKVFNAHGKVLTRISEQLLGRGDCAIQPAATEDEVTRFGTWYGREYPTAHVPKTPEKIQDNFYAYRQHQAKLQVANERRQQQFDAQFAKPDVDPAAAAATAAAIRAMRELDRQAGD